MNDTLNSYDCVIYDVQYVYGEMGEVNVYKLNYRYDVIGFILRDTINIQRGVLALSETIIDVTPDAVTTYGDRARPREP